MADTSLVAPLGPFILAFFSAYHMAEFGAFVAARMTFLFAVGFMFAKLSNKLIVAHMSKARGVV